MYKATICRVNETLNLKAKTIVELASSIAACSLKEGCPEPFTNNLDSLEEIVTLGPQQQTELRILIKTCIKNEKRSKAQQEQKKLEIEATIRTLAKEQGLQLVNNLFISTEI